MHSHFALAKLGAMPKLEVPSAAMAEVKAIIEATNAREKKIARIAEIDALIKPLQDERDSLNAELENVPASGPKKPAAQPRRTANGKGSNAKSLSEDALLAAVKDGIDTNKGLADRFGVSMPTMAKHVNALIDAKKIKTIGKQRGRKLLPV